jgi:hypothetical protein
MKKFVVTEQLLAAIVEYLIIQPYKDVNILLSALQLKEYVTEYHIEHTVEEFDKPTEPATQPVNI